MHALVKTVAAISSRGFYYVIGLKKNQRKLLEACELLAQHTKPLSRYIEETPDKSIVLRETSVYAIDENTPNIDKKWHNVKYLITVKRTYDKPLRDKKINKGDKKHRSNTENKPEREPIYYYITNLPNEEFDIKKIHKIIKDHWQVENGLHWAKDVLMKEDNWKTKKFANLSKISMLRAICINLLRKDEFSSALSTMRKIKYKIDKLAELYSDTQ